MWARGQLQIPTQGTADDPQTDFDEALAAFGMVEETNEAGERASDEKCYLWPENLRTFNVWLQVQTQWRTSSGMDGTHRTGLDYAGVATVMREVLHIRRRWWAEIWGGLRAMEIAAINAWAEQRQESRP